MVRLGHVGHLVLLGLQDLRELLEYKGMRVQRDSGGEMGILVPMENLENR